MDFYRVFDWDRASRGTKAGGPFHTPRARQGSGRHDIPEQDGVFYVALHVVSAVSEAIQVYRNQTLTDEDFEIEERKIQALAHLKPSTCLRLVDLTDPHELVRRSIRPSDVATHERLITQRLSLSLFEEGVDGFLWWSTLEATWTNATLFQSRVAKKLRLAQPIQALSVRLPDVVSAAHLLKIRLKG